MKKIGLYFVLSLSTSAWAADKEVKLLGVTSGFGKAQAVIGIWDVARNSSTRAILRAGQEMEGVEMVRIDAAKGAVSVKVNGEEREISMPTDGDRVSTNELDPSLPVIYFRGIPLQSATTVYSDYKKRTVLIHPQLGDPTFSLKINPRTEAEAVEAFEKLFGDRNIATIPDGEHFVMVVPFAFTNSVTPRSSSLPQTNSILPPLSINFYDAPMGLVFQCYADFAHKEIANRHDSDSESLMCCDTITLAQTTPLSKNEICYALETLLEWHKIRMAPDGNGNLKLERIAK